MPKEEEQIPDVQEGVEEVDSQEVPNESPDNEEVVENAESLDEEKSEDSDDEFYKSELARIEKERDDYKADMFKYKQKAKTVDPELVKKAVSEELEKFKQEMVSDTEAEIISASASSESEASLIKHHLENTFKRTGYSRSAILADVQKVKRFINAEKIQRMNGEIKQSLKANATLQTTPGSASKKTSAPVQKWSESEMRMFARMGIKPTK